MKKNDMSCRTFNSCKHLCPNRCHHRYNARQGLWSDLPPTPNRNRNCGGSHQTYVYARRILQICRPLPAHERCFGRSNIYWTIDKLQTRVIGLPDKDNVYFVKLKDKTVAPLIELTEDGIVRSINMPLSSRSIPATKSLPLRKKP